MIVIFYPMCCIPICYSLFPFLLYVSMVCDYFNYPQMVKIKDDETATKCIIREIKEELGVLVRPRDFLKQINHTYSHFSITLDAYHCDYVSGSPQALGCADWRWISPKQIADLPFPKANHKLFKFLSLSFYLIDRRKIRNIFYHE